MVAKDKQDFLFQLHNELHRIGIDANEDIFADFEEHFKASQNEGFTEEETCERLGDVKEIARNYIDIEDTRLNSIVAKAIENDMPHVSLTKPGRTESADDSLNSKKVELDKNVIYGGSTTNEQPIREYTPEHIKEEPQPDPLSIPSMFIAKNDEEEKKTESAREFTPEHIAAEPDSPSSTTAKQSSSANESGAASTATATGQGAAIGAAIGAAVEEVVKGVGEGLKKFGEELKENSAGEDFSAAAKEAKDKADAEPEKVSEEVKRANDEFSNSHKSDIPPQSGPKVGNNGVSFSDIKGLTLDINWGKLIMWIILDLLIFIWALPTLASLIIAFAGGLGITPIVSGLGIAIGGMDSIFAFHRLSEIFLGIGITAFGCMMTGLAVKMVQGFIAICKNIIMGHVKALFDL